MTAYEMRISDWSSDVCSSDLAHRRTDHRFRGRADDQRLLQLRFGVGHELAPAVGNQTVVRDDRHFLRETIDMVGFLFKEAQGNEQREIGVLDARLLDRGGHHRLDAFLDALARRLDHHAAAPPRYRGESGFSTDVRRRGPAAGLTGY